MYTTIKILLIMKQVEIMRKKKFVAIALDLKNKGLIIHIASISKDLTVYLFYKAHITF